MLVVFLHLKLMYVVDANPVALELLHFGPMPCFSRLLLLVEEGI